jgi:hypothetical protein
MKFLYLLLALTLSTAHAVNSSLQSSEAKQFLGADAPRNYIKNSGIEKNTANITDSNSIAGRTTSVILEGVASLEINAGSGGDKVIFLADPFQTGLFGQSCEANFLYQGDASRYKAYVQQNGVTISQEVTLTNSGTNTQPVSILFPCGSDPVNAASLHIQDIASGDAANIIVDSVYLGKALSRGTVAEYTHLGSVTWAPTTSCAWERTGVGSDSFANFSNDNECDDNARTVQGPVTDVTSGLRPAIGVPWRGPGFYRIKAVGQFNKTTASSSSLFRAFDGTNALNGIAGVRLNNTDTVSSTYVEFVRYYSASPSGSSTFTVDLQCRNLVTSAVCSVSSDNPSLSISAEYIPSVSQQVLRGDVTDLTGFAKSAATASCGWTSTSASMASFGLDSDCPSLTTSGNAASPSTKIPAFVAPRLLPGKYNVIAQGTFYGTESTSGTAECAFEVYDGTTSGGISIVRNIVSKGEDSTSTLVGQFEYTSTQSNKQFQVRVQRVSGNQTCVAAANSGDLTFTLIPLSQGLPQPFIPSSVFAGRSSVVKVGAARLDCNSSSSIASNPDSMVASIGNISSGQCSVTLTSGFFSAEPLCQVTRVTGAIDSHAVGLVNSATSITLTGTNGASASTTFASYLLCIGNN